MNILTGNEAITLGLLDAGADYMASYPITPASPIMNEFLKHDKTFLQTEDEIAAIHSIIGAALAGKKAFTATSGPGFSLMQEGIGLAFAYRVGLVVVNVQRQGPSTGMPTLFSQDNILQTQYGTHGDHVAITLYPSTVKEAYYTAILSMYLALTSRSPVILLSDAYLANLMENVELSRRDSQNLLVDLPNYKRTLNLNFDQFPPIGTSNRHFTGLCNNNGVPKTKDPEVFKQWISQILDSIYSSVQDVKPYEYIETDTDTLIIAYGTLGRLIKEWQDKYAILRPIRLFPVIDEIINIIDKYKKIVIIEGNLGQYKVILESLTHKKLKLISVTGGHIDSDKIYKQLKNELQI